ncbi:MAG TPA: histidine kinase, partial [Phnomibacter sp.]|nr:histidine kinase [Phnomibacter sp.]
MKMQPAIYKWLFALIFWGSIGVAGQAQTSRIYRALQQVHQASGNEEKLKALILLFDEHQSLQRDTMDAYGELIKQLGAASKDPQLKFNAQMAYANWYFRWGLSDSASYFAQQALASVTPGKEVSAISYFTLARANALYLGGAAKYAEALDVLYKLLPQTEHFKDTLNQALVLNSIGSIAISRGQYQEALTWVQKAITVAKARPDNAAMLAPAYLNGAYALAQAGQWTQALQYVNMAMPLCEQIENLNYQATGLRILSIIYTQTRDYKAAEKALLQMMEIRKKTSGVSLLLQDNLTLADFYAKTNQLDKAIALCNYYLRKKNAENGSDSSGQVFTTDPKNRLAYLEVLAGYYKQAGNTQEYQATLEELVTAKDSFYEANSAQAIAELQTQYDLKAKENTILQQKYDIQRKDFLFYATLAAVVLILSFAIFRFRQYRQQQQAKARQMLELQERRAQEAVKQAEEKERIRIAADLHDNLGAYAASMTNNVSYLKLPEASAEVQQALQQLHSNANAIVSQLNDTIWVLKKEALPLTAISDRIKRFIQIIGSNYPQVGIEVQENMEVDLALASSQAFHLYRLLQEAINNALKHSKGTAITLYFNAPADAHWQVIV